MATRRMIQAARAPLLGPGAEVEVRAKGFPKPVPCQRFEALPMLAALAAPAGTVDNETRRSASEKD